MAKAPTEEQSQLKRRARRRLVGSIALVTIVAVILPWVLEDEPMPADQQIAIQIPSPDAGKFEPKAPPSRATPPAAPDASAPAQKPPANDPAPAPAAPSVQTDDALGAEQAKVLAPPAKVTPPKPVPPKETVPKDKETKEAKERPVPPVPPEARKKPPEKSEPAAETKPADARPYVVQVAALADAEKAAEVQKAMAAKGLKVYTEKVKTASGEVTRVRVGPFPNRDAADRERARMKALGFDGNVLPK